MRKFTVKLTLFITINFLIFGILIVTINFLIQLKHWEKDPDIFIIPSHQHYDFILMGTSHARIFTRFSNQHTVESILKRNFFNLSQPDAGPLMEKVYLQFFLNQQNSTKTLVYVIDPHVFYSAKWNERYSLVPYGKLDFKFFILLIQNYIVDPTLTTYLKTYLSFKWFVKSPRPDTKDLRIVNSITQQDINERIEYLYPEKISNENFSKYSRELNTIISIAKAHKMKVVFILPPSLLQHQPGEHELRMLLEEFKRKNQIPYYDFSHAVDNPKLFGDLDHLNSAGVSIFTKQYFIKVKEIE